MRNLIQSMTQEETERLDSVEVKINQKGQLSAVIKLYGYDAKEVAPKAQELALVMKEWCKTH